VYCLLCYKFPAINIRPMEGWLPLNILKPCHPGICSYLLRPADLLLTDRLFKSKYSPTISNFARTLLNLAKTDDLLHYYKTVIRPVIEYACPVWQSSLTVDELRRLEAIQKRAFMFISGANDYTNFYYLLYKLEQVNTRLDTLTRNLYTKILQQSDC